MPKLREKEQKGGICSFHVGIPQPSGESVAQGYTPSLEQNERWFPTVSYWKQALSHESATVTCTEEVPCHIYDNVLFLDLDLEKGGNWNVL